MRSRSPWGSSNPFFAALLVFALAAAALAQQPDSLAPVPDSLMADSLTQGRARDSLAAEIAKELGADTTAATPRAAPGEEPYGPAPAAQGAPQSFNPDLSVIGDLLSDLSPDGSTLEDGDRFQVREAELGLQAVVDPYFRGDFFISLKGEDIELEEGYLTSLALPHRFQLKAGKFHLPYGKVNLTHRPEIHTIEYPSVIQEFFGGDGFASTGFWVSKLLSPFGFYQELIGVVGNDLGEGVAGAADGASSGAEESGSDNGQTSDRDLFDDLGDRLFLGHLKNYVDLTEAANLELGLSAATGKADRGDPASQRLTFYGVDAIYRWRPPASSLYKSLILQSEATWRTSEGPTDFGAFLFGQYQVGRRWYLGARYDYVEHPDSEPRERENSISGYLTLYPSEFSLFRVGYEHRAFDVADDLDRILVQAVVTLGPHRPHPF